MTSELQKFDEYALDVREAEELVSSILRTILRFEAAVDAGFLRPELFEVLEIAMNTASRKADKLRRDLRELTYNTAFNKTRV
tara:strand:+ start:4893 stop:5138 length:246 start_codon:yes stop_codon:yes gene_type:complete